MAFACSRCQYGETDMPKWMRTLIILIFSPLYITSLLQWIVSTVYFREQWDCLPYRADYPPSIMQQFLSFSVWSLWFSIVVFAGWIRKGQAKNHSYSRPFEIICLVGLPHVLAVFISYTYYEATNDAVELINNEICYGLGKSYISKEVTSNQALIEIMLMAGVISNSTIHYISAPLMLVLLWCGEISYSIGTIWRIYSTIFITVLGVAVGLTQEFGTPIYNGEVWFIVSMTIAVNFAVHCMLFGINDHRNEVLPENLEESIVDEDECKSITSGEESQSGTDHTAASGRTSHISLEIDELKLHLSEEMYEKVRPKYHCSPITSISRVGRAA